MNSTVLVSKPKFKTRTKKVVQNSNPEEGMLTHLNYQLPMTTTTTTTRASCSQFLVSPREIPINPAILLKEEDYILGDKLPTSPRDVFSLSSLSVKGISILRGSNDAVCVEQLLVHCATALENNDTTFAQQIMWVLNNIATIDGDPNQRVAAWFLRALVSRASKMSPSFPSGQLYSSFTSTDRLLTPTQLAKFVDLTPWHRFGFSAANGAILEAFQNRDRIHIIDFSISHCMQWPTLIEAFSNRLQGPPSSIRLSVDVSRPCVPPFVDMSYEELGSRLVMFARMKGVPFEFGTFVGDAEQLSLDLREGEAVVVNCQMRLHYLSQEDEASTGSGISCRDYFLNIIGSLQPDLVTVVEEDCDLTSNSLATRLKAAYNHLWIPFDLVESCLPRNHELRMQYEADIGRKIENIVACDGSGRIERLETREQWCQRLQQVAQLRRVELSDEVFTDVKLMLEQHATGWGLRREDGSLLLTWKGHNVVFANAWTPTFS